MLLFVLTPWILLNIFMSSPLPAPNRTTFRPMT